MKKIVLFTSILLAVSVAQAATLKISVDNRSNEAITIQKLDGLLTIPGNTKIDNQTFNVNEHVANYVRGKKVCTWKLKTYNKNEYISGLFYSADKIFSPGCIVIVNTKN